MTPTSRRDLIFDLRERTRRLESTARPDPPAKLAGPRSEAVDELLLGRGAAGMLVEWLHDGAGSGAATLAIAVAARILRGGAFVLIDGAKEFYPPAVARLGVPVERTVVVRPADPRDTLWAWEQALRCPGVAVAFGRLAGLSDRNAYRLQLAAEAGGGLGFLLRPAFPAVPSRAAVRLRVTARPGPGPPHPLGRRLDVEFVHRRGDAAGTTVELELGYEPNHVRLVSELARPAPPPRAAGA